MSAGMGPRILALAGLALAWKALAWSAAPGWLAVWTFALAALFLLLAAPKEGPEEENPRRAWEPWFVLALLGLSAALRFYQLGDLPPFAVDYEGDIANSARVLGGRSYLPHDIYPPVENTWPTIIHYTARFFGLAFGWDPAVMRATNAVYGVLSVLAFYFLARRLTSPGPAAVASVLYSLCGLHLIMSRRLYVAIPLVFFAVSAFYFLLLGSSKRRLTLYAAAGLCAGLLFNFYHPGKVAAGLFPAWLVCVYYFDEARFPRMPDLAAFAAAMLLALAPVIYFEILSPGSYTAWVKSMDPNYGRGVGARVQDILSKFPAYAKMFFLRGDPYLQDSVPGSPVMNRLTGAFFAVGFFACALSFWKTRSFTMLGLFFAGLLPAFLGALFPHPIARRSIMALPAAYLFIALALHLAARSFNPSRGRLMGALLGLAGLWLAWPAAKYARDYIYGFAELPVARIYLNHNLYLASKEMEANPGYSPLFMHPFVPYARQAPLYFAKLPGLDHVSGLDEMLALEPGKDRLLLMEPYLYGAEPLFKEVFPNSSFRFQGWEGRKPGPEQAYFGEFGSTESPLGRLVSVRVPATDIARGLVEELPGGLTRTAEVFSEAFCASRAPGRFSLAGTLLVPQGAGPVEFRLEFQGFGLEVDGKAAAWGRPLDLESGPHFFRIQGALPAQARGKLPLSIRKNGQELSPRRVLALGRPMGFKVGSRPGPFNFDGPVSPFFRHLTPALRLYTLMPEVAARRFPLTVVMQGRLRVPADGNYRFRLSCGSGRVFIGGKQAFSTGSGDGEALPLMALSKDRAVEIRLEGHMPDVSEVHRVLSTEVQGPPGDAFNPLPPQWVVPD